MPLVVHSPYSGKPVKVRDEDVSRAIRDEEGRIFYVVQRSTGEGYYASPTRQGSEKDEQRYLKMIEKSAAVEQHKRATTATAVHDATGKPRAKVTGKLVRAIVALVLLLLLIYIVLGYSGNLPEGVPNYLPGVSPPEEAIDDAAAHGTIGVVVAFDPFAQVQRVTLWASADSGALSARQDVPCDPPQPALESISPAPMSGAGRSEWPISC